MCGNFFTTMNYKTNAANTIHDDVFYDMVVLAGGISNGISRIIWGTLFEKFGFKYVFLLISLSNLICYSLLPWSIHYEQSYLVVYSVINANLGGFMVLIPNTCLLVFG